ncbi:nucleoporin NUP42 [Echeneis naucrates]|uniref:Nucleoporin NUP42 n=1 Tax=Echeneis naucrates TaxID=173247 RepID=A0A665WK64_ECHNA|nr:nucleoporin-like protein 2 [Echeneis naucrates]
MTVCSFFLQGRCRYGEKCWNEHPRGGGGGGGGGYNNNSYSRSSGQQQSRSGGGGGGGGGGGRGGGGFGNRVWVNPNQQKGGYIQPSSFSTHGSDDWGQGRGGNDWGKGGGSGGNDWGRGGGSDWGQGGGRRDNVKSSEFSFNRFSALSNPSHFDRGGRGGATGTDEDDDKKLEIVQTDMEIWESSRQWCFSCYSNSKTPLTGFTDLSPEELRLEYYSARASGDLQGYINGVNQLLNQWRNRVQELKVMNPATRAALIAELNNPAPQATSSGFGPVTRTEFGLPTSDFGSKGFGTQTPVQASSFSFAAPSAGFGSSAAQSSSTVFSTTIAASTPPPSGFGSSAAPSPSTFSFAAPAANKPAATSAFGSASGFSFTSTANTGGAFETSFGAEASTAARSGHTFGHTSGGFGASGAPPAAGAGFSGESLDGLFSPESKLTPEELNQFKAKRFTLGQIPLKPPPADMLV